MKRKNLIGIISIIAALITIFVFVTGKNKLFNSKNKETNPIEKINKNELNSNGITISINNSWFNSHGLKIINDLQEYTLLKKYSFKEASLSPNKFRIAAIDKYNDLHIVDLEGNNHIVLKGKTPGGVYYPAMLFCPIWAGDKNIRVTVDFTDISQNLNMNISGFQLDKPGIYEIEIDDYNTPRNIIRISK